VQGREGAGCRGVAKLKHVIGLTKQLDSGLEERKAEEGVST